MGTEDEETEEIPRFGVKSIYLGFGGLGQTLQVRRSPPWKELGWVRPSQKRPRRGPGTPRDADEVALVMRWFRLTERGCRHTSEPIWEKYVAEARALEAGERPEGWTAERFKNREPVAEREAVDAD